MFAEWKKENDKKMFNMSFEQLVFFSILMCRFSGWTDSRHIRDCVEYLRKELKPILPSIDEKNCGIYISRCVRKKKKIVYDNIRKDRRTKYNVVMRDVYHALHPRFQDIYDAYTQWHNNK